MTELEPSAVKALQFLKVFTRAECRAHLAAHGTALLLRQPFMGRKRVDDVIKWAMADDPLGTGLSAKAWSEVLSAHDDLLASNERLRRALTRMDVVQEQTGDES